MTIRNSVITILAVILAATVSESPGTPEAHAGRYQARVPAATVALGPLTVQPVQARVGQLVTITGRTTGHVFFLPPYVEIQSAKTVPAHLAGGPCQATQRVSVAEAVVVNGGGSGGKGSHPNPPPGTSWRVQFRMPRTMIRIKNDLTTASVTPPPGKYYITAIAAGMEPPCGLNTKGGVYISVATITLLG